MDLKIYTLTEKLDKKKRVNDVWSHLYKILGNAN